jgi:hypothetical protein
LKTDVFGAFVAAARRCCLKSWSGRNRCLSRLVWRSGRGAVASGFEWVGVVRQGIRFAAAAAAAAAAAEGTVLVAVPAFPVVGADSSGSLEVGVGIAVAVVVVHNLAVFEGEVAAVAERQKASRPVVDRCCIATGHVMVAGGIGLVAARMATVGVAPASASFAPPRFP